MTTLLRDLRFGLRLLARHPGFTLAALVSLALGIGANTAIFQLVEAVRLRSLPIRQPDQLTLVQLSDRTGWRGSQAIAYPALTNPLWERFRDTQSAFDGVLAWSNNDFNLAPGGQVRLARGLFVSGDFFRVLGVAPILGRVFVASEDRRSCGTPGAVLGYGFWQREYGGDPSVIGRTISLNDRAVPIVGVTPEGFSGVEVGRAFDVAVPIYSQATLWNAGNWLDEGTVWWLAVMGRLKPGATIAAANARLRTSSADLFRTTLPANYPGANVRDYLAFTLSADPAASGVSWLRGQYEDPLLLLLATTGLVLLITCANLANLTLARATAREHELAVRLAIGASRARLIRQLMMESALLAAAGGGLGLMLAGTLSQFLVSSLATGGSAPVLDVDPDWLVLAFTTAIAGGTCVLFGLAPALRASRVPPGHVMKAAGRTTTAGKAGFLFRRVLVVSQISLSLVLVVSALLFSGSLRNLLAVDPGFQDRGVLVGFVDFSRLSVPSALREVFKHDLLERLRARPGVEGAAEVGIVPLSGGGIENKVWTEGADASHQRDANFNWISAGYFHAMGIPLVAGRDFGDHDTTASPDVAIVNQAFTRLLGLGKNPIGQRFHREVTPSEPEKIFEIVGLVGDTKYYNLREASLPVAFLSTAQDRDPNPFAQIVVRSAGSLAEVTDEIKTVMADTNPLITVSLARLEDSVRDGLLRERLMATLSALFGALAAVIAAVGLYGVMSYLVVSRTSEIGIRVALGADQRSVMAMILREAAMLLAIGLGLGAVLSFAVERAARSMLFGVAAGSAEILLVAVALLATITLAAAALPARRAARLDPLAALRCQ